MLRKIILLTITSTLGKMAYARWRAGRMRSPFPTSKRPLEGHREG